MLRLGNAQDYYYINQSTCFSVEGMDDGKWFISLKEAMESCGFEPEVIPQIFKVVAGILHLGRCAIWMLTRCGRVFVHVCTAYACFHAQSSYHEYQV